MIERVSAAALGTVAIGSAALPKPVVWHTLGYQFEAASMIAAMFAAITTRIIINTRNKTTSRVLDFAVLALVMVTTWAVVASMQANLITGLVYGTGIATIGEGLIAIAEKYTRKGLSFFDVAAPPPAVQPTSLPVQTPAASADGAAIGQALSDLDRID